MPFDNTYAAPIAARGTRGAYPKLAPSWLERLLSFREIKQAKKEADKAARELDSTYKVGRAEIAAALDQIGTPVVMCGDLTVIMKQGAASPMTMTLASGAVVPWARVKAVVLTDGLRVPASDIAKLFGGREGSLDVDIIG